MLLAKNMYIAKETKKLKFNLMGKNKIKDKNNNFDNDIANK